MTYTKNKTTAGELEKLVTGGLLVARARSNECLRCVPASLGDNCTQLQLCRSPVRSVLCIQIFKIIESPAPCEVRSAIHFLSARNLSAADIHRQICEVYGATTMCEGKVRKWVREFKAGRDNVHDDSRSGRPSVITDGMVVSVEAKILEKRRFTISTLSNDFPEVL
ncbi:hypothetical protein AVEN_226976-1 [Araneus ventricosus]|uniref:Mos1 transposase HTH domain-containing protein n=1 Tax=Araneus ventricosus TaxID=182803 RepID=A0A4Y2ITF2_ARAVE|nr:hypothetical protein AVEN_226976-1 [Araneus ventricosus]